MKENKIIFPWTLEQIALLKKLYPHERNEDIANVLKTSKSSVENKAGRLNLKKDATFKSNLMVKRNKNIARDLTPKLLSEIALLYKTRGEFQEKDSSAYQTARKMKILDEICRHMAVKKFSRPQLILKNILIKLLNQNCVYNDRKIIKPYEIDVYFPMFKLAFEYDGSHWHKDGSNDELKEKLLNNKNIILIRIFEFTRNYEMEIKEQLITNLTKINTVCRTQLTNQDVISCKIINVNELIYNREDLLLQAKQYNTFTELYKNNFSLYETLRRNKMLDEATLHMPPRKTKRNIEEVAEKASQFSTLGDLIREDFGTYCYIKKHKLNHLIQNLPDTRIKTKTNS